MYGRSLSRGKGNIVDTEAFVRNNVHEFEAFVYGVHQNKFLASDIKMVLQSQLSADALLAMRSNIGIMLALEKLSMSMQKNVRINNVMTLLSQIPLSLEKRMRISIADSLITNIDLNVDKPIRADVVSGISDYVLIIATTILKIEIVKTLTTKASLNLNKQARINIADSLITNIMFIIEKKIKAGINAGVTTNTALTIEKKMKSEQIQAWTDIGQFNSDALTTGFISFMKSASNGITMDEITGDNKDTFGLRVGLIKLTKISQIENQMISDIENMILNDLFYTRIF